MWHLDDNLLANGRDKLFMIRTVIETVRRKFISSYSPSHDLVIDTSVLWKGKLGTKRYISIKRNRNRYEAFILCDSKSDMVLAFIAYFGKDTQYTDSTIDSGKIIETWVQPYLNTGHTLYKDNWYCSPTLFECLSEHETEACGTVRSNQKTCIIKWNRAM